MSEVVDQIRISWNSMLPQMEEIAVAMQEKLYLAEDAVVRSMAPVSAVPT